MATSEQALSARAQSLRELWFRQGTLLAGRGRNAEAVDALEHALGGLGHEPPPLAIMAELAGAYAAAGKKEDAFRAYLQASNADPEQAFELIGKAARLVDPELANTVWSWLSNAWLPPWTAHPRQGAAQVARLLLAACACSARAKYADALEYVHQAEEACGKDCALAAAILGELDKISDALSRSGELDLAARALQAEVRLGPTIMGNRWNLVDVLRRKSWTAEPPGVIRSDIEASARAWEEAVAVRRRLLGVAHAGCRQRATGAASRCRPLAARLGSGVPLRDRAHLRSGRSGPLEHHRELASVPRSDRLRGPGDRRSLAAAGGR
jgi:tetratricopeptide (TPR) repeat protein